MVWMMKESLIEHYKELNSEFGINENTNGEPIVIGCNYHTTWQSHKDMRFILSDMMYKNGKLRAVLKTRRTKNMFTSDLDDLIFITTKHNIQKSKLLK
jgi:hypothetical protein